MERGPSKKKAPLARGPEKEMGTSEIRGFET